MPHLTIEYTSNLKPNSPFDELFARLHAALADLGGIKKANCKSRAVCIDQYFIGDGSAETAFVHVDVRILEGRPMSTKQEIGKQLLAILCESFPSPANVGGLQVTVEIRDIQRAVYFKHPEGSLKYGLSQKELPLLD